MSRALPLFLITASVAHAKPGPARTATEAAMAKIKQLNNQLHAVITVNPEALAEADALDKEPKRRGPLHGVTVLLKANIATRGPVATIAGSLALAGVQAPRDAFLVARLHQAGAVVVGKANLSEWANLRSTTSSSGWSAIGGQTRNPYALDRAPCGSSSGTGAAVAVEMAQVGVGTDHTMVIWGDDCSGALDRSCKVKMTQARQVSLQQWPEFRPKMIPLLPGTFAMGSPASDMNRAPNEQQHAVQLTTAFALSETEVTQRQSSCCARTSSC